MLKKIGFNFLTVCTIISFLSFWSPMPALAVAGWQQVGGNGLGDPDNYLIPTMEVWNNAIYVGVGRDTSSARIYRSTNGTTWNLLEDDFGHAGLNTLVDLHPFGGRLYASVGSETIPTAAEIWRSDTTGTTWTQFGTEGLDDAGNTEFFQFEEFGGKLYVGSLNAGGGELWRTDGTTWEMVANGFSTKSNTTVWGLINYDGYLYAGTANTEGAQIWRSTTGNLGSWTKYYDYAIEGEPGYTVVNLFSSFKGHLYWSAGNMTTGAQIVERLTDATFGYSLDGLGDANNVRLSENALQVGNNIYFGTMNPGPGATGGELWSSTDGLNATQIGTDGFGDVNNYALYALAFKSYMYIGFSNADTGLQIYRRLTSSHFHFATENLPDGTTNQSYSTTIKTSSGKGAITYAVSDGSLPPGLNLDKNSGEISGTPTQTGDFTFEVTATDSNGKTVRETFTLKIIAGVAITNTSSPKVLPETGADL